MKGVVGCLSGVRKEQERTIMSLLLQIDHEYLTTHYLFIESSSSPVSVFWRCLDTISLLSLGLKGLRPTRTVKL